MSLHTGHRERIKERFLAEGLDNFSQRHALELLLCFGNPRGDTAQIAQDLLDRFGTVSQVLDTPWEDMKKVKGVGDHIATLLTLIPQISRYYLVDRATKNETLQTTAECGAYLFRYFHARRNETVFMLCLDAKCKVLCCRELGEGGVNSANVPIRRIVETALSVNATTVVLGHNHPSGLAVPSADDVFTTRRVAAALDMVDIKLADHIVVADDDYVSLAESGMYYPGECRALV